MSKVLISSIVEFSDRDTLCRFVIQAEDGEIRSGVLSAGELWSLVRTKPSTWDGKPKALEAGS